MNKLVIIHFSPLELYPPIQNLIRELERLGHAKDVVVLTTRLSSNTVFQTFHTSVSIRRLGRYAFGRPAPVRFWNYFRFYATSLLSLLRLAPDRILYVETLSSWPAYIYKKLAPRCEIYIHYHEYTSPQEYRDGMRLTRYFHSLEKRLYPRVRWISHTNALRLSLFAGDHPSLATTHSHVLPNYPPRSWARKREPATGPLRLVYVGSLSLNTMFVEAFSSWVVRQNGSVQWDIYSHNYEADVVAYWQALNSPWIVQRQGTDYDRLPEILCHYDLGVILYKGTTPNYVYNAPNKLFEYLACGLSVWLPTAMIGSLPYCDGNQVAAFDFDQLDKINLQKFFDRRHGNDCMTHYFCEEALAELMQTLFCDDASD